ncbi:myxosortase-dependent M36 family metallopeptidase [Comamonas sp. JC664]|nr:myxosortase-dependent M36 family metallopeptidase [Comamonas sp. JC664]MBL0692030.1 myxosortase-dependent M36 family metallopeptidase [Comamonas sp. JC664]
MELPHVRRLVATLSGLALVLSGTSAVARSLPNYDALQDAKPAGRAAAGFKPVNSSLKGARIAHRDALTDSPTFVWTHRTAEQTKLRAEYAKMAPDKAAMAQLSAHAPLYGLRSFETAGATVTNVSANKQGVKVVTLSQKTSGIEVFRQSLKVLLNKHNEIVAISGNLSKHASSEMPKSKARFQVPATDAIAAAYKDLTGTAIDGSLLSRVSAASKGDSYSHYTLASYARPLGEELRIPARVKQVYFPLPTKLVPAYYVELFTGRADSRNSDYFAYVISATDGQLLMRNDLTAHAEFSYRVWADTTPPYTPHDGPHGNVGTPHPVGTPNGYVSPYVPSTLITLQNVPFSQNDPWLPDGATVTRGNNVDAYADLVFPDGYNTGDRRPEVTAPGVFDRSIDFGIQPNANNEQIDAATTSLFYLNNWLHDWYYDAGFDEASGNAQASNFGRGGLGNDVLLAQAQDHEGTDNANMRTPADGASPRMQMFLFSGARNSAVTANAPAEVAGDYQGGISTTFGPQTFNVTGNVVAALDEANTNGPTDRDGCTALTNAAEVAGNIAVIDRGSCDFTIKVTNAQNAGAIGVIIHDNVAGPTIDMGGTSTTINIPALRVNLDDGNRLRSAIPGLNVTLFRGQTQWIDGTLDNAIVAHEWGHYISNRLIGNSSGLVNNQGRGMGEGWGDFTALLMMVRAEDINVPTNANWNGAYAAAAYATRADADSEWYGIRRTTYSSDTTKNGLFYRHIMDGVALPTGVPFLANGLPNSQVHNSGEVWATMLWECYTSLLRAHPFQDAQDRMKNYLVNAYKLTPSAPTFLEARDAVIAAAYANDPADAERFWAAFAKRGAGVGAQAPDRYSTNNAGVVESYGFGSAIQFVSAEFFDDIEGTTCDRDGVLDNGETGRIEITVRNVGATTANSASATLFSTTPGIQLGNGGGGTFPPIPVFSEAKISVPVSIHGAAPFSEANFSVAVRDDGQAIPGDIINALTLVTNFDEAEQVTNIEDVEVTPSKLPWTTDYDEELTPDVWGVVQLTETNRTFYAEDLGSYSDIRLITPELNVSATEPFVLNFMHAYDLEGDPVWGYYDGATVEITEDGGDTWVDIGGPIHNATLQNYNGNLNPLAGRPALSGYNEEFPGLIPATINLGTAYAGKTVQIRFRIGTDESFGATGWLLDDLEFTGITNTPFAAIVPEDGVCVNRAPAVNAGADVSAAARSQVSLTGTATDPDGDALTYSWTQTAGPAVSLTGADTLTLSFTAPQVTESTTLTFTLTATDGTNTSTDSVNVTVTPANRAPTVNAGIDATAAERSEVTLTGSASDEDGDALTYLWTQVSGTPVALKDYTSPTATFVAPEVTLDEQLVFRLTVSDGAASANDTVTVTITNVNRAPVVTDTSVAFAAGVVTVSASALDPDGDALSYSWAQTAGGAVSINGADTASITFATPAPGSYEFTVTASDGEASASKAVAVTIISGGGGGDPSNTPPTVNAGADGTASAGDIVTLSGSASDAEGDPLTYVWQQIGGTPVALSDASSLSTTFVAPGTANGDTLAFLLTVSDGNSTVSDVVRIIVAADPGTAPGNTAPVVSAGAPATVTAGSTVTLNGTATDADGDALTATWTQIGGPAVTLSDASSLTPTFTAPATTEALSFLLLVSDGTATVQAVTTVTVTDENVAPVAAARAVVSGNQTSATLDGSASSDANGDALTYRWTQTSGPTATINGANQAVAVANLPDLKGKTENFGFRLTVTDAHGAEHATTVTFSARNGDDDGGGCSATGAGAPAGMIGLALLGLLRRRRQN